jgi:serine protease inhibitor
VLEKNLKGGKTSFIVLLPDGHNALPGLEASLTPGKLAEFLGGIKRRKMEVHLPYFILDTRIDMKKDLAALGMPDAFSRERADFSAMRDSDLPLWIYLALHRTWISVNEEGIEAAAASVAAGCEGEGDEDPPPVLRVDRPFLFLVRHKETGAILFLGRVVNPLQK